MQKNIETIHEELLKGYIQKNEEAHVWSDVLCGAGEYDLIDDIEQKGMLKVMQLASKDMDVAIYINHVREMVKNLTELVPFLGEEVFVDENNKEGDFNAF